MGLERTKFPDVLIDVALSLPTDLLEAGMNNELLSHIESLELAKHTRTNRYPTVLGFASAQRKQFEADLSIPTPSEVADFNVQPITRFGALQLVLGSSIGTLMSIPEVRKGAVLQDIFPKAEKRMIPDSSYGSESVFSYHNDLSFLSDADMPTCVTLGCVRNEEQAATNVASIIDIVKGLKSEDISELQKSQFYFRHRFNKGSSDEYEDQIVSPVLLENDEIRLGVDMVPVTAKAQIALEGLRETITQSAIPHILQPGEFLVLPNKHTVHARGAFTMAKDPRKRRWLQRINIM